jgi:tetratricopeptide (TPR) repeat protein
MQIRTPKQYRGVQRRSTISCRKIFFYLIAMVLIVVGIGVYQNRAVFAPTIEGVLDVVILELEEGASTLTAPEPTPTQDPSNKLVEGNNYWSQGAVNEALQTYMEVLDSVPNEVVIFDRVAVSLITLGRTADALEYAEKAINADPYSADAWAIRAWALDWDGRSGEALSSALHALELNPESSRAKAYLAEAYQSLGQTDRALGLTDDIIEENPNSSEAYRARGIIKWTNYDLDGAVEDFQTAYSIADNMTFIAIDIATIESARENFDAALDILEGVVEANPQNTLALFQLGYIHNSQLGNPSQAISYLQNCVDYNPQSVDCFYLLGRAQYRLELYQEASSSFEQTMELGTNNPYHYYWAGWSQINIGNCARAMAYLDPGYQISLQGDDTDIVSAFETVMPECRSSFGGLNDDNTSDDEETEDDTVPIASPDDA